MKWSSLQKIVSKFTQKKFYEIYPCFTSSRTLPNKKARVFVRDNFASKQVEPNLFVTVSHFDPSLILEEMLGVEPRGASKHFSSCDTELIIPLIRFIAHIFKE
jgi:hypothetical protein